MADYSMVSDVMQTAYLKETESYIESTKNSKLSSSKNGNDKFRFKRVANF